MGVRRIGTYEESDNLLPVSNATSTKLKQIEWKPSNCSMKSWFLKFYARKHLKEKQFLSVAVLSLEGVSCSKIGHGFLLALPILTYISENAFIQGPLTVRWRLYGCSRSACLYSSLLLMMSRKVFKEGAVPPGGCPSRQLSKPTKHRQFDF